MQIILDVPTVGGRLMLVDMAGSENIDQAGQTGFEAKMQVNCQGLGLYCSPTFFCRESLSFSDVNRQQK